MARPFVSVKRINEIAKDTLQREIESLTEEEVVEFYKERLSKAKEKFLMDLLGMEISWGEVRVKYDSILENALRTLKNTKIKPLAENIWNEIFSTADIVLSEKQKTHLKVVFKNTYLETLEDEIAVLAKNQALLDAPGVFEDYLKEE